MSARCWKRLISAALGLATLTALVVVVCPCRARAFAEMSPASKVAAVERALQITQQTGRPTVVVATSGSAPHSHQIYEHLLKLPKTRELSQTIQFTELPAESSPEVVQRHRFTKFPTVLVFRKGAKGLELAGREDGARDAYDAAGYLCTLDLRTNRTDPVDPGVKQTNYPYGSAQQPTPQGPPMAMPQQQQAVPAPQPVYAAPAPQPIYVAPAPQPVYAQQAPQPVYVTPTAAPVVVQPPTQTIVMAPQPAPNIVFAAPAAQPTISMAPAAAPQPAQLFMAPTAAAAAPAPVQVMTAPAAAPVAAAPMMMATAPVAAAPMMMAAAPVATAPAAPAQAPIAATFMTLVAPNLIERLVGTIGEHLAQKKNPRLQTTQAPIAYAPAGQPAYAPAPAVAPLGYAPAAYAPAAYAPAAYAPAGYEPAGYGPAARRGPYPQALEPEYTTPSPQNAQDERAGLFHRLHH